MKKPLIFFALCLLLLGCSGDDEHRNNPYLVDLDFVFHIELSLPQYNQLNFPGNSFPTYNYGIKGVVIFNMGNDQYRAFELTDPNHPPSSCSRLEMDGITEAFCGCDDANRYSVANGLLLSGEGEYMLKEYRVVRQGSVLEISN